MCYYPVCLECSGPITRDIVSNLLECDILRSRVSSQTQFPNKVYELKMKVHLKP
jgi:hypothetical protein